MTAKNDQEGCVKNSTRCSNNLTPAGKDALENEKNLKPTDFGGAGIEFEKIRNGGGYEKDSPVATDLAVGGGVVATLTQESVISAIDSGTPVDEDDDVNGGGGGSKVFVVKRAPLADDSECNVSSESEDAV